MEGSGSWTKPVPSLAALEALVRGRPPPAVQVQRVNQLDSSVLDGELQSLLRMQLTRVFGSRESSMLQRFSPEVAALFDLILFRFSVARSRPTPGMRLQNLAFRDERVAKAGEERGAGPSRRQRLLYGVLLVGVPYAFTRLRRHGLLHGWADGERRMAGQEENTSYYWKRRFWLFLAKLDKFYRFAYLLNLLLFLRQGKYPHPVHRLLQMKMVYDVPGASGEALPDRLINYHLLNRNLLWEHFTRTALTLLQLPVMDLARVKRVAAKCKRNFGERFWGGAGGGGRRRGGGGGGAGGGGGVDSDSTMLLRQEPGACVECRAAQATNAYVTSCGHTYCYYCLKAACLEDEAYCCIECGDKFSSSMRWDIPK